MWKKCSTYDQVVVCRDVSKDLSVLVHGANSLLSHYQMVSTVVDSHLCIHVTHEHNDVSCWSGLEYLLQLIVVVVL